MKAKKRGQSRVTMVGDYTTSGVPGVPTVKQLAFLTKFQKPESMNSFVEPWLQLQFLIASSEKWMICLAMVSKILNHGGASNMNRPGVSTCATHNINDFSIPEDSNGD